MSETIFKKVDYTVQNLLSYVEVGDLGLPELQRPFVWSNIKVRDLFDSMYRGYPIGYFLFWENGLPDHGRPISPLTGQRVPKLLIVDGQQRITSLFAVIKGREIVRKDGTRERIKIAFRPRDGKFEVSNAAIQKDPEWIADISPLWSPEGKRVVKTFFERLRQERGLSQEEEDRLDMAIDRLRNLIHFPLVALELSSHVDEERVAEVFVRINSKGTSLNQANFILTLMSVFWDKGRLELERFCAQTRQPTMEGPSPFNRLFQPSPDHLLRVSIALGFRRARLNHAYTILRGKDLETREFSEEKRDQQFQVLRQAQEFVLDLTNWHEFIKVILQAGFRRKDLISSQYALLYTYAFYLIGKRDFHVDLHTLRNVSARWLFMVSLTGRYTDSPESRMEQDLADLRNLSTASEFVNHLEGVIASEFTEDYWNITLPNELATTSFRSPALFAYYAALVLLDARAFFSKLKIAELLDPEIKAKKSALNRHHLFPKAYLAKLGIKDQREVNQIANLALIEWSDNEFIGDNPPKEYMPWLRRRCTPDELAKMNFWHALPDGWEDMDYYDFLKARQKLIAQVIRRGFEKLEEVV
ncbi:DUF262 domain-containing protein [Candidatus Bipolaricaulota bacterium]|nr:DUF262 domain-containing protein [Candidatus Bipolaricaulota bacterium]